MGEINKYFFDTYALFELLHKNKNYSSYLRVGIITTLFNLMELHYRFLILYGDKLAEIAFNRFLPFIADVSPQIIKEANKFKCFHKKRKLSYVDCIGYVISRKMNIKFLTGDKEFKNMENVEFVK